MAPICYVLIKQGTGDITKLYARLVPTNVGGGGYVRRVCHAGDRTFAHVCTLYPPPPPLSRPRLSPTPPRRPFSCLPAKLQGLALVCAYPGYVHHVREDHNFYL